MPHRKKKQKISITDRVLPLIDEDIREKRWGDLKVLFMTMHPADIAELLVALPSETDVAIFRLLDKNLATQVYAYLPPDHQQSLVYSLSHEQMAQLLEGMTPDDQVRLLDEFPPEVTRRMLESVPAGELTAVQKLLGYPEGTAGRFMTPEYVAIKPDVTAGEALKQVKIAGKGKETLNVIYIVDADGTLQADVRLGTLVLADEMELVIGLEGHPLVAVKASDQVSDVVVIFQKYGRSVLPVTDVDGRMLGIITSDDILDAAQSRATDEIQKLGGSETLDEPYRRVGLWAMLKKRGGWLAALFLGETLTATAMGQFENEIQRAAVVALFVPLIISSGGNSGSQATSIIIRSLALAELELGHWWSVFRKELMSGILLGMFLGGIGFLRIILWYYLGWQVYENHPYLIGFTVWLSLIGVVTFGTITGSMLPFILRRIGLDPATASAPFVATLVDVTGLIIYFTIAMLILKGTLL